MIDILSELEAITGVSAADDPFTFALCLIPFLWIAKNFFGMLYSFVTGGK